MLPGKRNKLDSRRWADWVTVGPLDDESDTRHLTVSNMAYFKPKLTLNCVWKQGFLRPPFFPKQLWPSFRWKHTNYYLIQTTFSLQNVKY